MVPFSSSPIDWLISMATSPPLMGSSPFAMSGRGKGSSLPLHSFCVLQQGAHQADDLGGWLDCVVLCKQVAHILL